MEKVKSEPLLFALGGTFIGCFAVTNKDIISKYGFELGTAAMLKQEQIEIFNDIKDSEKYVEIPMSTTINSIRAFNYQMNKEYKKEHTTLVFGAIGQDENGDKIK